MTFPIRPDDVPSGREPAPAPAIAALAVALARAWIARPSTTQEYHALLPEALFCCILLCRLSRTVLPADRGKMEDDPVAYAARDSASPACP